MVGAVSKGIEEAEMDFVPEVQGKMIKVTVPRMTTEARELLDSEDATAVAYVEVTMPDGRAFYGVGRHPSIVTASLRAVVCAVNRAVKAGAS